MPGLIRAFLATDEIVKFQPTKQQFDIDPQTGREIDVTDERAKQAQDYINYVFLSECQGYCVVRSAMHDGLALANGVIKHWWDDSPEFKTETFYGLDEDQLTQLLTHPDVEELLEYETREDPAAQMGMAGGPPPPQPALAPPAGLGDPMGSGGAGQVPPQPGIPAEVAGIPAIQPPAQGAFNLAPGLTYNVKVRRKIADGRLRVEVVPPEEFLIEPTARGLDEGINFCAHYYQRTRSDLIEDGYDVEFIDEKPAGSSRSATDPTRLSRTGTSDPGYDDAADRSTELVDVYECYVKVDVDGDGVAERRRVVMVGGLGQLHMVENEAWDEDLPFSDIVPDPVPHRWRGTSLYERLRDVVRNKTVLLRQTHDNLYHVNNPMQEVVQDSVLNLRALVNRTLGANIFVKQRDSIRTLEVPFTADKSFNMLAYWDKVAARRTGMDETTMGLDPDALQNQTAEAVRDQRAASATKQEDYARNIEVGLRRAFKAILKIVHRHQDRPKTLRIRGQWVNIDPTQWDPDMDVIVNTGLGTGSRDRDLMLLNGILTRQEQILLNAGPQNPLVTWKEYGDTLSLAAEVSGIRNPERHFKEITKDDPALQPQPPQEDPKVVEAKAKAELENQKAAAEHQRQVQKDAAEDERLRVKIAAEQQAAREKAALDVQTIRDKAAAEIETMRQKQALELQLTRERMAQEAELKRQELMLEAQLRQQEMKVQAEAQPNIEEAEA
jgi:hypothetical protein